MRRDADGQEWVGDLRLLPYRLPLGSIAALLERVEAGETFLTHDPDLGWSPRPGARGSAPGMAVEAGGVRSGADVTPAPTPGVLRVALFGDSFTFGDEVPLDETWGAFLERGLEERGVDAEVLNFGVNAYGIDQAYLRWRRDGKRYHPQVVVLGFQPENVLRDLNVFRPFYFAGSEVPLSKPRFVVRGEGLDVRNVPTVPPRQLASLLASPEGHPLLEHERFHDWYAPRWWRHAKVLALVETVLVTRGAGELELDDEAHDLAARLIDAFARDVAASGAAFLVVHLPRRMDLEARLAGAELWYATLLREIAERHTLLDPTSAVAGPLVRLFAERGHYAAELNRRVGEALVEPVLQAAAAPPHATSRGTSGAERDPDGP